MRSRFISGGILDLFERRTHNHVDRKVGVMAAIADEGADGTARMAEAQWQRAVSTA